MKQIHLVLACGILALPAFGQTSIITDRPDQTESAQTVPLHHFQIEAGAVYEEEDGSTFQSGFSPAVLLRYGIGQNTELRLGSGATFGKQELVGQQNRFSEVQPVLIGMKLNLREGEGFSPAIGILGHINLPLEGKDPLSFISPDFRVSISHDIGERFSLGYNLGIEWDIYARTPWNNRLVSTNFIYTLALGYAPGERLGFFGEVYGFANPVFTSEHFVDGGITFLLQDNLQLDASAGMRWHQRSYRFVSAGISWRLPG